PGQFARVRAVTKTRRGALLVPQRAVTELQGSYQVAVVSKDNKVEIRPVKVGERTGSQWVVDAGLKPGERVIAEGIQRVRQGMTVNPKPLKAETEAKPAPTTKSEPRSIAMSKFFINRPIVAMVISIVMVIVGIVAMVQLPIAQFPELAPPEILLNATYVGADALTLEQSVATPIEQQLQGVDNMI